MKTLFDAQAMIERKLSPSFLAIVTTSHGQLGVRGDALVSLVNDINHELLNIKMAINIFGGDFVVASNAVNVPEEYNSLFVGMCTWRQYNSHYIPVILHTLKETVNHNKTSLMNFHHE